MFNIYSLLKFSVEKKENITLIMSEKNKGIFSTKTITPVEFYLIL